MKTIQKISIAATVVGLGSSLLASTDYGPAIWSPTCNPNYYTSGNGHHFCVIHDMEGYYLSTISMMDSCSYTAASVYYCVNGKQDTSTDHAAGEITQLVREANYAWHACCWNTWMFGTEHEGFASNPAWYTASEYQASASLQKHLAAVGGVALDRNHIVGHNEHNNATWCNWVRANYSFDPTCNTHTDPGVYWDWAKFMNMITASGNRVGMARTATGNGYWIVASDGGVFSFGDATFYGSMGGQHLNKPVVGMAARPQGDGYWLVASDGGIFSFGNAGFHGSMGGQTLSYPIVGMASTKSGNGYWLIGQDGGIFSFGDAAFYGSQGSSGFHDFVAMAPAWHADGSNGYWLVRANGAIYSYNCSYFGGSNAGSGVTCMTTTGADAGYWQMTSDGRVYSYGNAAYHGGPAQSTFVGMARGPSATGGYWGVKSDGAIFSFGDAAYHGGANF